MLFDVLLFPFEEIYCLDDAIPLIRQKLQKPEQEGSEHRHFVSSLIKETEGICRELCNENPGLARYEKTDIYPVLLGILLNKS